MNKDIWIDKNDKLHITYMLCYFLALTLGIVMAVIMAFNLKLNVFSTRDSKAALISPSYRYEVVEDESMPAGVSEHYRFQLDDLDPTVDCLAMYAVHQSVFAYVNGEKIYSLSPDEGNLIGRTTASNVVFIPILPEDEGKVLEVILVPIYKQTVGLGMDFYLGAKADIYEQYLRDNIVESALCVIAMIVGVVFLIMGIFVVKDKHSRLSTTMLGTFAFEIGLWKLFDITSASLVFEHNPIILSYVSIAMLSLMMMPFMVYIKSLMNRRYAIMEWLCLTDAISDIVLIGLQLLNIVDLRESLLACHIMLVLSMGGIAICLVKEAVAGNLTRKLKVTNWGIGICAVGIAIDMGRYYLLRHNNNAFVALLGFDLYIITMGILFVYESHMAIVESRTAAEEASRAKSRFLSNMSHDIRTPMNAIVGFTKIAEKSLDDPERLKDALSKIEASSEHLIRLVNDVLDMSKIESGKITLDVVPASIKEVLDNVVNIMDEPITSKGIEFVHHYDKIQHRYAYLDTLRVNQVLLNLLGNAQKFTRAGGRIILKMEEMPCEREGYASYEIRVKDTGIGMSEEFKAHAFEAFVREHDSMGNNIQGTGLGLTISKNIVEMVGGSIRLESLQGAGTEFIINLDLRIANESDVEKPSSDTDTERLNGKRVLLVDDNQLNREIVIEILGALGMILDSAEDGDIAVEKVASALPGFYDVILMDIQMPIMDGYTASKAIRALENKELANIPIIAMTANAFEEDKQQAYEAGMNAHVSKPLDIDKLIAALNQNIK